MENNIKPKKNYGYKRFLASQTISMLGSEIVGFVLGVYLAQEYGNAFYFAISMILQFAPRVIIGPIAGVWADKRDRKKIVIVSDLIQAIITTILVALFNLNRFYSWAFWANGEIMIIFGFIFLRSVFQAVQSPSVSSILPSITPIEKLSRLNGALQFASGVMGVIAPIIATLLINIWEIYNLLWIDAVTFSIALVFIFTVSIPKRVKEEQKIIIQNQDRRFKKFLLELSEGISVTKEFTGLSALLAVFIIANILVTPINTLSELLILKVHEGSVANLMWVSISFSAGMIAGSIISALKKSWKNFTITLFLGIIGLYIGLFFIGIAPPGFAWSMWMIIAGGFFTSFGIPIFSTIISTMIQLIIPIDKMGRFSGFATALISILTPIGYLLTGLLAEITEIRYVIIGASIVAIMSMICIWSFSQIDKLEPLAKERLALRQFQHVEPSQSEISINSRKE